MSAPCLLSDDKVSDCAQDLKRQTLASGLSLGDRNYNLSYGPKIIILHLDE